MSKSKRETVKSLILKASREIEAAKSANSKRTIKRFHKVATERARGLGNIWIKDHLPKYSRYFANGKDINPEAIHPILIQVSEDWHYDLFRLARYYWSLPYTKGYGRRLRFLVLDESNECLIGILGLQSPPLDFSIRDDLFNYPEGGKINKVNQTMDIYTLGALPPYNRLLGGKLIALSATSNEVRKSYMLKYRNTETILEKQHIPARLVALTTTSAFGRSSIYNRLSYNGQPVAISLGYTKGYGSFHFAKIYPKLREFLEEQGVSTKGGYGVGPRIMWSTCTRALTKLGLPSSLLKHGIEREGFIFPIAKNYKSYLEGRSQSPQYFNRPFLDLSAWWKERWLLPRSSRVDGWHKWRRYNINKVLYKRD